MTLVARLSITEGTSVLFSALQAGTRVDPKNPITPPAVS